MTPFKRDASPYFYVWPTVPGYGRVGPWSTGTRDRRKARDMETMLRELPLRGYGDVLEMIGSEVSLREVYVAKLQGRLGELVELSSDPRLHEVVEKYWDTVTDRRKLDGLNHLVRLTEPSDRFSLLLDSREVRRLLHEREAEGVARNTVHRGMYLAISGLLQYQTGNQQRAREIMSGTEFTREDDERHVVLSVAQIERLLDAIHEDLFRHLVVLALTTGMDLSPILRIQPEHFDPDTGDLDVYDSKTTARPRTLSLGSRARRSLLEAVRLSGAEEGERVFDYALGTFYNRWYAAREAAGLDHVRFKDLRSVFATAFLRAGGSPKDLQAILGHANLRTTMRYIKRLPTRSGEDMGDAEKRMGLGRYLKLEEEAG